MWVLHVLIYTALAAIILLNLSSWEENEPFIGFLPSEFGLMFISCLVVWCFVKCQAQSSNQGLFIQV